MMARLEFRAVGHRAQRAWEWRRDAFFSGGFFLKAALLYRRALSGVIFIGVTGSCGKSTTKELISAVLAKKYRVHRNPGNDNQPPEIAKSLFSMRPGGGQCCVMELSPAGYHGTQLDFSCHFSRLKDFAGVRSGFCVWFPLFRGTTWIRFFSATAPVI